MAFLLSGGTPIDLSKTNPSPSSASSPSSSSTDDALIDYIFNPDLQGVPLGQPDMINDNDLEEIRQECAVSLGSTLTEIMRGGGERGEGGCPVAILESVKKSEADAIKLAESNQLDEAIALFNDCITRAPTYAAAYNNRSQALQLKYSHQSNTDNNNNNNNDTNNQLSIAIKDCTLAIYFSCISHDLHTLRLSLNQRALMRKKLNDQEGALRDFQYATKCGSKFARKEAVKVNPYAAMCNAFLSSQLENLKKPIDEEQVKCTTIPLNNAMNNNSMSGRCTEGKANMP